MLERAEQAGDFPTYSAGAGAAWIVTASKLKSRGAVAITRLGTDLLFVGSSADDAAAKVETWIETRDA